MVQVLDAAAHPLREVGVVNYVLQKHELLGVFCHPKDARLGKVGRLFFLLNVTLFDLFVVGAWALAAESSKKVDKALESTAGQLLLQGFLTAVITTIYVALLRTVLYHTVADARPTDGKCSARLKRGRATLFKLFSVASFVLLVMGVAFMIAGISNAKNCDAGCFGGFLVGVFSISVIFSWVQQAGTLALSFYWQRRKEERAAAKAADGDVDRVNPVTAAAAAPADP